MAKGYKRKRGEENPQGYRVAAAVTLEAAQALREQGLEREANALYEKALKAMAGGTSLEISAPTYAEPKGKEAEPPREEEVVAPQIEKRKLPSYLREKAKNLKGGLRRGDEDVVGKARKAVIEYLREYSSGTAEEIGMAAGLTTSGILLAIRGGRDYVGLLDMGIIEQTGGKKLDKRKPGPAQRVFSLTDEAEDIPKVFKSYEPHIQREKISKRAGSILEIDPIERMIAVCGTEPEEGKEKPDYGIYNTTVQNILKFFRDRPSATVSQISKRLDKEYETILLLLSGRKGKSGKEEPGLVGTRLVKRVKVGGNSIEYRRTRRFEGFFKDAAKHGNKDAVLEAPLYAAVLETDLEYARQTYYSSFSPVERVVMRAVEKGGPLTQGRLSRKLRMKPTTLGKVIKKLETGGALSVARKRGAKGHYTLTYSASSPYAKIVKEDRGKKGEVCVQPEPELPASGFASQVYTDLREKRDVVSGVSSVSVFMNLIGRPKSRATLYDIADHYGLRVSQAERLLESLVENDFAYKRKGRGGFEYYTVHKWIRKVHGKGDGRETPAATSEQAPPSGEGGGSPPAESSGSAPESVPAPAEDPTKRGE